MALNPFFLQGSSNEQFLLQDLINEHLRTYGIDIHYIPRKVLGSDDIIREVETSKFDDNFAIEAYLENFEGYAPGSDIMTKFGINLQNEVTLILSKERFEEFVQPFMADQPDDEMLIDSRPREGDLVFFPLGERLFEVKRVEHEQPFYQLGTNYVYKLQCELFQYEGEDIDTSIDFIDTQVEEQGYITELTLVGTGITATLRVDSFPRTGMVRSIELTNDGSGYTEVPTVTISDSPSVLTNATAKAVAITTVRSGVHSIDRILLTNTGFGYTEPPTVTITSIANTSIGATSGAVYGTGAAATAVINSTGITSIRVLNGGTNYFNTPTLTIDPVIGIPAILEPQFNNGTMTHVLIRDAGQNYGGSGTPTITVDRTGIGSTEANSLNYQYNEEIIGAASSVRAKVRSWTADTGIMKVGINSGTFFVGELVVGSSSGARRKVQSYDTFDDQSPYDQNDEFETQGLDIIDFTEENPFGTF
jgi:hypothetical protein